MDRKMFRLFGSYVEAIDAHLPRFKAGLMTNNRDIQAEILQEMLTYLPENSMAMRESVVAKIIKFDIVSCLCDVIKSGNEKNLETVFDCLSRMIMHRAFYENCTAPSVVNATLNLVRFSILSEKIAEQRKDASPIKIALEFLCNIICNCSKDFHLELHTICDPRQVLLLLRQLNPYMSSLRTLRFEVSSILITILKRSRAEDTEVQEILHGVCLAVVDSMKAVVAEKESNVHVVIAVAAISQICRYCARYCKENDSEHFDESEIIRMSTNVKLFQEFIYDTVINVIVPEIKNVFCATLETPLADEWYDCVVCCLNNLYFLREFNHKGLSHHLTTNGCLKYFLRLTAASQEKCRRRICLLLSQMLRNLAEPRFSLCDWPTGPDGFSDDLFDGFSSLPREIPRWSDVLAGKDNSSMALMLLCYYHYYGTDELYAVTLSSLIARVMNISTTREALLPIVKPLWLLFAASTLSHPGPESFENFHDAVERLSSVLQHTGIIECYSHHIVLVQFSLVCDTMSPEVQRQVIDSWFIETDGDVRLFFEVGDEYTTRLCLDTMMTSNYPEDFIAKPANAIRELIELENAESISLVVWEMLAGFLESSTRDARLEAVLELASITEPDVLSDRKLETCTDSLIRLISSEDANSDLKSAAVNLVHGILCACRVRPCFEEVMEKIVNENSMLRRLWRNGFAEDVSRLSEACLDLLACVCHFQGESMIECKNALTIEIGNLSDLLWRFRETESCIFSMHFVYETLTSGYEVGSCVILKRLESEEDFQMLRKMFSILHVVYQLDPVCRCDAFSCCLSKFLLFCHEKGFISELKDFLARPDNDYFVQNVIATKRISGHLLYFIVTWLRLRRIYGDYYPGSCPLFDESLIILRSHVEGLQESGYLEDSTRLDIVLKVFERIAEEENDV